LAVSTHDAAAAQIGDTTFIFGGGEAQTIDDVQAFRGTTTALVGHLPQPRSDCVATVIGGHAYILGGFDGQSYLADVLDTTDGVTFRTVARLPTAVRYPAVATIGSTIYLFGGQSASSSQTNLIQAVDVAAGTAKVVGQLAEPIVEAAAYVVRGAVFLAGGRSGTVTRSSIDRLDLASGALAPVGTLPNPVADAASASIGDTLYLFGGESPGRLRGVLAVSAA
jgi:N-acetylneuraminic acid mutarotase